EDQEHVQKPRSTVTHVPGLICYLCPRTFRYSPEGLRYDMRDGLRDRDSREFQERAAVDPAHGLMREGTVPRSRAEGSPLEEVACVAARTIASAMASAASAPTCP